MDDMSNKKLVIFATILVMLLALGAWLSAGTIKLNDAEAAWQRADYAVASESYARAAQLLPWRKDLWEKAGIAAGANGDFPLAVSHLERAPGLSEQGWAVLGFSYFNTGDVSSAIKAYQRGLRSYDSYALYAGLAHVHYQQKDWPAERDALENQVRLNAGDAHAHYRLGLLYSFLQPEKALSELTLASSLDPQFGPAAQTLRAALTDRSTQPGSSEQLVAIGRALGLLQEWDLSLAAFEKAIEMDADNAQAWAWLGEAKQQTGGDGRVELDKAVRIDHTSVTVRALRGLYWDRQEKYPQMLAEYLLAAEYEPQNPAWRASIGDAYLKVGDLVLAFAAYQRATALAPQESTYWRLLAVFCAENGVHLEDAGLPAALKAVELAPDDPLALDALGFAYSSSGRFANAEQTLLQAIELAPGYFPAHIHLAMNHLSQGNRAAAFNELTYVRDADKNGPNGLFAERLLAQYFP
jgi:tetratricopeptide (TPR) repeat protein